MGMTPGRGDSGPELGWGGSGITGVASGEGLGARMKRDAGEEEEDFWPTSAVEGGLAGVGFVAAVALGVGMKPGGEDKGEGFGAGIKPTTSGTDDGLE